MQSPLYIAVIGDIVDSRKMPPSERRSLQNRLAGYLDSLVSRRTTGIVARPLITLGDEFQALFATTEAGVRGVHGFLPAVLETVRPTAVRLGLGIGPLTTALQELALGMDGPCFHRARAALERCRSTGLLCQCRSGAGAPDALWSTLAAYVMQQRLDWTAAQREAISLYLELGAWNQVAATLRVSPGAVSLRQKAAGWTLFREAESALNDGLRQLVELYADEDDREKPT